MKELGPSKEGFILPAGQSADGQESPSSSDSLQLPRTPLVPRGATEEMRLEYASLARNDLYFLITGVLGYDKLIPRLHGPLCKFLQGPVRYRDTIVLRRMIQLARSFLKTTCATIGHSIFEVINDINIRILLVASSAPNAERFMKEIQNHFEHNRMFQWLFPELIPEFNKTVWNAREMQIPRDVFFREPTIDTIGSKGDVQSRHYDVIKADDIIGEKELQSESEMAKTIEWASGLESLLVSPTVGRIDYVGTRWKLNDVYAWVEESYSDSEDKDRAIILGPHAHLKGELAIFRIDARDDNGDPTFPQQVTREFLDRFMRTNPQRYAAQYANNPMAEGTTVFSKNWLKYYVWAGEKDDRELIFPDPLKDGRESSIRLSELERGILVDPATSEHKRAARNAIIVFGELSRMKSPMIFILHTEIGHYQPDALVEHLFNLDKEWQPRFVSIERFGFQGSLKFWVHEYAETHRLPFLNVLMHPRKGDSTSQLAKDERIKGLQPFFRAGQIVMQEGQGELIEEFLYYPNGKFRDGLDALAQGPSYWSHSTDESKASADRDRAAKIAASITSDGYSIRRGSPLDANYIRVQEVPEDAETLHIRGREYQVR